MSTTTVANVCEYCGIHEVIGRSDKKYCSVKCGNLKRAEVWRSKNRDKIYQKNLIDNSDVAKRILTRVKSRAKSSGISFNLDLSDVVVPDVCPVLGIPIYSVAGGGTNQYHSPSLDRIVPEKGYTKGNVRVISQRANLLKSNATVEELELVLKDLRNVCMDF